MTRRGPGLLAAENAEYLVLASTFVEEVLFHREWLTPELCAGLDAHLADLTDALNKRTARQPVPASQRATSSADKAIAAWSRSRRKADRIAAMLGWELLSKPRDTRLDSSLKIAERFFTSNTTAVQARKLLVQAKIIRQSDSDRRYYVA